MRIRQQHHVGRMARSPEARELWLGVYEKLSAEQDGLVGGLLARAEAQVLRLSMLYALFDKSAIIQPEHLLAAMQLWAYVERSVRYVFGDATGDHVADTIYRALKQNGPMSRTQIFNLFGKHESSSRIDVALAALLSKELARTYQIETGGRPVEMWAAPVPAAST